MSEDEMPVNSKSHKQLLAAINSLGKSQHIRKPTRNEPKATQDEFQLDKDTVAKANAKSHLVDVDDIVHVLKATKKHLDIGKQLKSAVSRKKVLQKPLEKPAAERIKRSIGYENVKKKLARWDAVVTSNRAAETQVFPLKSETVYVNTTKYGKPLQQSVKSDLMLQIEDLENRYNKIKREQQGDTQDPKELERRERELLTKKLSKDELIAKRRELAYLKMRESQKSAKSRLQNKIKSKKYHKLLKKQRLQEQIKQFELLQKTDPEGAIEKLNQLEKSRILERANLRHKNTGSWAKNLQIRAKYDKDVRIELAEQLKISRQLTQKVTDNDSEEEMEAKSKETDDEEGNHDPFNPWIKRTNNEKTLTDSTKEVGNWRKYWMDRNDNEKLLNEYKRLLAGEELDDTQNEKGSMNNEAVIGEQKSDGKKQKAQKGKNRSANKRVHVENGWLVEELNPAVPESIDAIFEAKEEQIKENLQKKLEIISHRGNQMSKIKKQSKMPVLQDNALKNLEDLSFKIAPSRPIIDEELQNELVDGGRDVDDLSAPAIFDKLIEAKGSGNRGVENCENVTCSIDPNKIAPVKLKQGAGGFEFSNEALNDVDLNDDDNDSKTDQQITIAQAFEDDDIVADFSRDKSKESELKNAEIQLAMPGWGSWAGAGISKEQMERRNKRMLLKLAPLEKRKDANKDGVYINENPSKKLRSHLVSDIPFPFTSLESYEASIRSPLGRNFVTETSLRMLTRPSIITQKGKVIEPMDESVLIQKTRKLRNPVDVRIANITQA